MGQNPDLAIEKGDLHRKVRFDLKPGEKRLYRGVWYKGKIKVNVAGTWHPDFHEPLWVMSVRVEPQQALKLYLKRMKIEQQFKDFKSLLHLEKLMNKSRENMEKMVALAAIAYAIGVLVGEKLRDAAYRRRGKKMGSVLGPVHPAEGVGKPKPD